MAVTSLRSILESSASYVSKIEERQMQWYSGHCGVKKKKKFSWVAGGQPDSLYFPNRDAKFSPPIKDHLAGTSYRQKGESCSTIKYVN